MLQYADDRLRVGTTSTSTGCSSPTPAAPPEAVEAVRQKLLELAPDFEEIIETTAGSTVTSPLRPRHPGRAVHPHQISLKFPEHRSGNFF